MCVCVLLNYIQCLSTCIYRVYMYDAYISRTQLLLSCTQMPFSFKYTSQTACCLRDCPRPSGVILVSQALGQHLDRGTQQA